jgi:hypothetical protein
VPAPLLPREVYDLMTARRKKLYDLHRTATHANMAFLDTPMTRALGEIFTERVESNSVKWGPSTRSGIMVNGGGFQGKTEAICEFGADFAQFWLELNRLRGPLPGTRDLLIPVAYVQTPVTAKPKSTCVAILDYYGVSLPERTPDLPRLTRMVKGCPQDNDTKVLILDDITRLRMHRADGQDTLDLIRSLMSMHVTRSAVHTPGLVAAVLRTRRRISAVMAPGATHASSRPGHPRFRRRKLPQQAAADLIDMPYDAFLSARARIVEDMDLPGLRRFLASVDDLAAWLNGTPHRVDFGMRRKAMATWALDAHTWEDMIKDLPLVKEDRTGWRNKKRLLASTFIWQQVTCGDHRLAPLIPPASLLNRPV